MARLRCLLVFGIIDFGRGVFFQIADSIRLRGGTNGSRGGAHNGSVTAHVLGAAQLIE